MASTITNNKVGGSNSKQAFSTNHLKTSDTDHYADKMNEILYGGTLSMFVCTYRVLISWKEICLKSI